MDSTYIYNVVCVKQKNECKSYKNSNLKSTYVCLENILHFVHKSAWYKTNDLFYLRDRLCFFKLKYIRV